MDFPELRDRSEQPMRQHKNRVQGFLEKHKGEYEALSVREGHNMPIKYTIYLPKSELEGDEQRENRKWYEESVKSALHKNETIFKTQPPNLNYLFINTTEEWNEFNENEKDNVKVKGDRLKGCASYPNILCFTPRGLRSETNFTTSNSQNESAPEYVQALLDHETAHNFVHFKYGKEVTRSLPSWMGEGIPMVINHSPIKKPFSPEYEKKLKDFLKDFPDVPPSEKD